MGTVVDHGMLTEWEMETLKALRFSLEYLTAEGFKTKDIDDAIFHLEMLDETRHKEDHLPGDWNGGWGEDYAMMRNER